MVSYALVQLGKVRRSGGVDESCFKMVDHHGGGEEMGAHHRLIVGQVAPGIMHGGVVKTMGGVALPRTLGAGQIVGILILLAGV